MYTEFQILKKIGSGENAEVYSTSYNLAMKVFNENDSLSYIRICQEALITKMYLDINSEIDNVKPKLGLYKNDKNLKNYLISPKYTSIKDHLKNIGGKSRNSSIMNIIYEMFNELAKIHSMNIIHGDISINNIMMSDSGHVQFIDFGNSCIIEKTALLYECNTITDGYAAPETFILNNMSQASDVWSTCMVAIELITGNLLIDPWELYDFYKVYDKDSQQVIINNDSIDSICAIHYLHLRRTRVGSSPGSSSPDSSSPGSSSPGSSSPDIELIFEKTASASASASASPSPSPLTKNLYYNLYNQILLMEIFLGPLPEQFRKNIYYCNNKLKFDPVVNRTNINLFLDEIQYEKYGATSRDVVFSIIELGLAYDPEMRSEATVIAKYLKKRNIIDNITKKNN